ncbi:hypothetical protein ABZ135_36630 [Streptomyces sp. NPDC006339]|uniref:hypothetical protein n=1 Tax=Streptomyces sp. NPDC006339 TaxID=3156755 RepID=UPI0033ADF4A6
MIWATRGAIVVGLSVLAWYLVKLWWPGLKALQARPVEHLGRLLPFLAGWAYGALGILAVGGLIGWAFDTALWVTNWLGDAALVWGVGGTAGISSRGNYLPLTGDGAGLVLVLTVLFVAAVKATRSGTDLKLGSWCGLSLGTSSGIAGFAAVPLAQATNATGHIVFGWIG